MKIADPYTHYERGLMALLEQIPPVRPAHTDLLVFQQRLTENIRQTRLSGDTEQWRADRATIIVGLNILAHAELGVDFNTLCGASAVTAPLSSGNRAKMLDKVESFWVKGVLEQSLYQIARLDLGLEQAPEKIDHPWQAVLRQAATSRSVPAGTPVINLFDELDGKLLILGAPGGGKTTLLLELARDLIGRARSDPQHPIPLVFNLSTWASKHRPLKEWLADELNQRYDVPAKLAPAWIEDDAILPLLDGLDEVDPKQRDACVVAINDYRQERGTVPLAVCSRVADYEVLATKLRLQGAIVIQPLTHLTVDTYLRQVGRPLAAVRAALKDDPTLWELLDSPLLLSIVALAYKDKPIAKLRAAGTSEERRRHLFDDYVTAMFTRRGKAADYTQQQTAQWISWLAEQMMAHKLTVYYIEQMQPDWLPLQKQRHYPRTIRLVFGLFYGLVYGLIFGLGFGLIFGLSAGLIFGLGLGLIFGLGGGFIDSVGNIKVTEILRWSWSSNVVRDGLIFGLAGALLFGLTEWFVGHGSGGGLRNGLFSGLSGGLIIGLLGGFKAGLSSTELEIRVTPNQGIHRGARSWLFYGLANALLYGLGFMIIGAAVGGLRGAMSLGLAGGLIGWLNLGLDYGARSFLKHYTLRWMLSRNGLLPLSDRDLIPFLDHCAERIFLRKVGGGYIFVHRLLLEHFASLNEEEQGHLTEETTNTPA